MLRTIRLFAALSLAAAGALTLFDCGADLHHLGESDAVLACHDQCTAQAKGKNCPYYNKRNCNYFCDEVLPGLKPDCQQKAQAMYECGRDQEWVCPDGTDVVKEVDPPHCDEETAAYNECVQ